MVGSGPQYRSRVGGHQRPVAPHPWEVEVPSWTGHQALPSSTSRGLLEAASILLFHPHGSTETNRLTNGSGAPVCTRGVPRTPRHGLRARRWASHMCPEWRGGSPQPGYSQGSAARGHTSLYGSFLRTVRERFVAAGVFEPVRGPPKAPGGPQWLPKSPTSTIEGRGSLPLASGAHAIKLCNSFTIRKDPLDRRVDAPGSSGAAPGGCSELAQVGRVT